VLHFKAIEIRTGLFLIFSCSK